MAHFKKHFRLSSSSYRLDLHIFRLRQAIQFGFDKLRPKWNPKSDSWMNID